MMLNKSTDILVMFCALNSTYSKFQMNEKLKNLFNVQDEPRKASIGAKFHPSCLIFRHPLQHVDHMPFP
jgi:hypothetical protein